MRDKIFAGIDIGSNAVRLLVANVFRNEDGELSPSKIAFVRVPLRLGEDVFSVGKIKPESVEALVETLLSFKSLINLYHVDEYAIYATAAMRESSNQEEVVETVLQRTGEKIQVIDGMQEAGIIRIMGGHIIPEGKMGMYVDVGGGSTEISLSQNRVFVNSASFRIGTLRLLQDQVEEAEWERLEDWLRPYEDQKSICLLGSGGNINKLCKIFGNAAHGYMDYDQLKKAVRKLEKLTVEERMEVYKLRKDRADVILPAAGLFLKIMKMLHVERIFVPKFGLADGLVCKLFLESEGNSPVI